MLSFCLYLSLISCFRGSFLFSVDNTTFILNETFYSPKSDKICSVIGEEQVYRLWGECWISHDDDYTIQFIAYPNNNETKLDSYLMFDETRLEINYSVKDGCLEDKMYLRGGRSYSFRAELRTKYDCTVFGLKINGIPILSNNEVEKRTLKEFGSRNPHKLEIFGEKLFRYSHDDSNNQVLLLQSNKEHNFENYESEMGSFTPSQSHKVDSFVISDLQSNNDFHSSYQSYDGKTSTNGNEYSLTKSYFKSPNDEQNLFSHTKFSEYKSEIKDSSFDSAFISFEKDLEEIACFSNSQSNLEYNEIELNKVHEEDSQNAVNKQFYEGSDSKFIRPDQSTYELESISFTSEGSVSFIESDISFHDREFRPYVTTTLIDQSENVFDDEKDSDSYIGYDKFNSSITEETYIKSINEMSSYEHDDTKPDYINDMDSSLNNENDQENNITNTHYTSCTLPYHQSNDDFDFSNMSSNEYEIPTETHLTASNESHASYIEDIIPTTESELLNITDETVDNTPFEESNYTTNLTDIGLEDTLTNPEDSSSSKDESSLGQEEPSSEFSESPPEPPHPDQKPGGAYNRPREVIKISGFLFFAEEL